MKGLLFGYLESSMYEYRLTGIRVQRVSILVRAEDNDEALTIAEDSDEWDVDETMPVEDIEILDMTIEEIPREEEE